MAKRRRRESSADEGKMNDPDPINTMGRHLKENTPYSMATMMAKLHALTNSDDAPIDEASCLAFLHESLPPEFIKQAGLNYLMDVAEHDSFTRRTEITWEEDMLHNGEIVSFEFSLDVYYAQRRAVLRCAAIWDTQIDPDVEIADGEDDGRAEIYYTAMNGVTLEQGDIPGNARRILGLFTQQQRVMLDRTALALDSDQVDDRREDAPLPPMAIGRFTFSG